MIYLYDGSFEGLMSAIYTATYEKITPFAIEKAFSYQDNLLEDKIYISTDKAKSDKVKNAIHSKLSESCYFVFVETIAKL